MKNLLLKYFKSWNFMPLFILIHHLITGIMILIDPMLMWLMMIIAPIMMIVGLTACIIGSKNKNLVNICCGGLLAFPKTATYIVLPNPISIIFLIAYAVIKFKALKSGEVVLGKVED